MDFIKQWTFCVCITIVTCTIFSLITPRGNLGRFFKIVISIIVFLSLLYPLSDFRLSDYGKINFDEQKYVEEADNSYSHLLEISIKEFLRNNSIEGASVRVIARAENEVITIDSIQVAVPDEYGIDSTKDLLLNEYGVNARVIHIGE